MSKFQKPNAAGAAKAATSAKAPAKKASRWAGIKPPSEKNPMYPAGEFFAAVKSIEEGENNFLILTVEHLDTDRQDDPDLPAPVVGQEFAILMSMKDRRIFDQQMLGLLIAMSGLTPDQYVEFDDGGMYEAAVEGRQNDYSELSFVGRVIGIHVRRGKDDGKGSYYRNCTFVAVDEENQPEGVTNFQALVA